MFGKGSTLALKVFSIKVVPLPFGCFARVKGTVLSLPKCFWGKGYYLTKILIFRVNYLDPKNYI